MPNIHYMPDDREVVTDPEDTILQASLKAGIPHTHVCGGNARCTTCRVMILEGLEFCVAARTPKEQTLAEQLRFDPMIRLACQTKVFGDVKVRRLVLDNEDIELTSQLKENATTGPVGEEKLITILFADIRGFTAFAERQLPYDVIHVLNRYFHQMGLVISGNNGHIDNYMGDGLLAIFEAEDPVEAVLNGVKAGLGMLVAMTNMQPYLEKSYGSKLQIGIGIHCGEVVVGTIGGPYRKSEMVIGDAVNFASRIESKNKEIGSHLLISENVYQQVGQWLQIGRECHVQVRGKRGDHTLYEVIGLNT